VDSTDPGFRIIDNAATELVSDLEERLSELNPSSIMVEIQLLDNSTYEKRDH
jgi:hypothetical protein